MGARRKYSAEYKREAVAMLDEPGGVTVSQIAPEVGIVANVLGRWQREFRQTPKQAFVGNGRSRDEEVSQLRAHQAGHPVERCHNPRQRRRLERQQQGEQFLTQLSVETGYNPCTRCGT